MITFIESGNRIATENFETGEIYTITYTNGNYRTMCCIGIGTDFVMFQGTSPNALFCLTLGTSETVSTIELGGGGSGTMNYNELENKPQINGIVLIGNKTASDLNLVSQNDLDNYVTDTELSTELADYATNASVVSALASKQDILTTTQLTAVNSGITSSLVSQITTNQNNILSLNQASSYNMAGTYNSETGRASFAELYKLALDSLGLDTSVLHHYIVHVYTNTVSPTADLLIMYGTYYYNNSISHAVLYNSQLSYYADNKQGTLLVSGGDATIHASVRFLD